MASIQATQIRKGIVILHNGVPHRILEFHHHTPGNLRAMVQTRMRNMKTGTTTEHRFRSTESVERAQFEEIEMTFLYSDADGYHFMNMDSYEQVALNEEVLGESAGYLLPETVIKIEFFEGNPIGITIPAVVELTVVETEPEIKGATVSNVGKPAKLETGITVQVPAFIKEGEKIRVDTTEGRYMERAK
ncbi:MAG: elongation factor P [Blastocatellia bacterium]